ncbi:MAG TPA: DUF433 domain-containing protein [Bacteroidales bacterium]|nr:DUF433 domain-containing protein [Bacteroidales bacterium]
MSGEKARIGEGIYTAADISRIFKIPYPKAKYWFKYYVKNRLFDTIGYRYFFPVKDTFAINFLSLIEMYVFYKFKERKIKTHRIIEAHTNLSKYLCTPYPFASEELYTYGDKIFFGQSDSLKEASDINQTLIPEYISPFVKKIHYDDKRLASKFYPLGKDRSVVINPENQFGQPIIDGTNILTATLYDYYLGNDSIETIAKLFDLRIENVLDAIEFHKAA